MSGIMAYSVQGPPPKEKITFKQVSWSWRGQKSPMQISAQPLKVSWAPQPILAVFGLVVFKQMSVTTWNRT